MELDIIQTTEWNVKRGKYRIKLVDARPHYPNQYARQQRLMDRLIWEIIYPFEPGIQRMLGKNYPSGFFRGCPLYRDLCDWKGIEYINAIMQEGKFNIARLYGHEADAVVGQKKNEDYKNPYSHIKKLYPPGTLVHLPPEPKILQICDSPALPSPPCTPTIEISDILDINIDRQEGGLSNAA